MVGPGVVEKFPELVAFGLLLQARLPGGANAPVVEQQLARIGQGKDVEADALARLDLVGRIEHLPEQGAPHVADADHRQVDLLADAEDLPVDHVQRLEHVGLAHHQAHVFPRHGVVEQQGHHLVADQGIVRLVEGAQVLPHDRDHRHV